MIAYRVRNVKITDDMTWSGVVIADDDENANEAIMKHHGVTSLFDEDYPQYRSRNYSVEEIPVETVNLCDLTVGELFRLLKHFRNQIQMGD